MDESDEKKENQQMVIQKEIIDSKFLGLGDKTYTLWMASKFKTMHVIRQWHTSV